MMMMIIRCTGTYHRYVYSIYYIPTVDVRNIVIYINERKQ